MRYIKLITAALLIALCCALSACGFVEYVLYAEPVAAPVRMEATLLHCDFRRYRDPAA